MLLEKGDTLKAVSGLSEIAIEINRACKFACSFCFYRQFYESKGVDELPKEKIFSLLSEMSDLDVPTVRFFGGDPILRNDFSEILNFAKSKNLFTIVNTNGIFDSKEHLHDIVSNTDLLIISLHGFDELSEKVLTGRGDLFKKILINIKLINQMYPGKLMVSSILTKFLIDNYESYVSLLKKLDVDSWGINRPMFSKEHFEKYPWLDFSKDDVINLVTKLDSLKEGKFRVIVNNYPHCMFDDKFHYLAINNEICRRTYNEDSY